MAKALSVKRLEAIKPTKDGVTEFKPDGLIGGLGIRYGARGRPCFSLVYRVSGKQRRVKLGYFWNGPGNPPPGYLTLAQARERAAKAKDEASQGRDPVAILRPPVAPAALAVVTFRDVAKRFYEKHLSKLRSHHELNRAFQRNLVDPLGDRPLANITRADLRDAFGTIQDRGAAWMANQVHSIARMFFTWAVDQGHLLASPMVGMKRPMKNEPSRDRVLTDDEIRTLWGALEELHPPRRDCIRLLMLCGTRRAETAAMKWSDLDIARREWTIPAEEAKNGMAHTVYLSDQALAIIESRREDRVERCEYVFSYDGKRAVTDLSTYFGRLAKKLGLDIRLHDLRRSFASGLQRLGVQPQVIDKALNHSAVIRGVAAVYQRASYADERRIATERWGAHVAGLLKVATPDAE